MIHARLLLPFLLLFFSLALPQPTYAEEFIWKMNDGKRPQLVFGIPESDGAMFVASCRSPARIDVQVATDVTGLSDGEEVDVGFRGNRFNSTVQGTVIGTDAENGITGAAFRVSADDSFWHGLIKQGTVKYGVAGFAASTMRFGEDREEIQAFIDRCSGKAKAKSEPQQDAAVLTCDQISNVRSKNSKLPVTITFVNKTDAFRSLMWIDFKGQPQDFGSLNPGERKVINTFVTHPWMFTDGPGNCQEIYLPKPGDKRFNITQVVSGGGD